MPQRFLRPGIRTSERWNRTSFLAQSLYIGILTLVDDFGRYDGRPKLLHGECFVLRDDVKPQQTAAALQELHVNRLLQRYECEGKEYIQVLQWQERIRCDKSRFPDPPQESAADRSIPQQKDASIAIAIAIKPSPVHHRHLPSAVAPQLQRVKGFFRKRPETQLDVSERKAWETAKEVVIGTSEDEWLLLEWAYGATNGDAARFRRKDMATLLNNWNGEIARAENWKHGSNSTKPRTALDEEYDAAMKRIAAKQQDKKE